MERFFVLLLSYILDAQREFFSPLVQDPIQGLCVVGIVVCFFLMVLSEGV